MAIRIYLFLLFLALTAYGQQQERVAIINTVDDGDSIKFSDLAYLTDRLRETAVNILLKQRYGVMTTESIVAYSRTMNYGYEYVNQVNNSKSFMRSVRCLQD